jgi:O-antigen/teichoic acid export membrane protein
VSLAEVGKQTRSGVKRRIIHGVGANAFGTLVTTFLQLVTVPVLIHSWGTRTFGEWLVLSAVPAFLGMSDWGFENVSGNEITQELSSGNPDGALAVYQTMWTFVTVASIIIVATVALVAIFFPAHVAVVLQGGMIRSGFRSTGRYATGVIYQNLTRVAEGLAVIVIAFEGGKPLRAALAMLAVRSVMTLISEKQMRRSAAWLTVGFRHASFDRLRGLLPGTAAMMAFPLGFALSLQGMVTLIGVMLGPVAVVSFATVRTLSRLVFQVAGVISSSTLPEISFAFAKGQVTLVQSLHRRCFQSVGWLTIVLSGVLALTGGWVLRTWTRGAVHPDPLLLYTMLAVAIGDALWTASSMTALGAGKYHRVSAVYVMSTALSLVVAGLLFGVAGIMAAPIALLMGTVIMLPFVVKTSLALSADNPGRFFAAVIRPPSVQAVFARPRVPEETLEEALWS